MPDTDSLETRGFLSAELGEFRAYCREKHAKLFAVCEAKSDDSTRRLFAANIPSIFGPEKLHLALALGFWNRCLSACQAALLLCERGMVPESQVLIRSAYEFLFFAVATAQDPDVLDNLMHGDTYARYEQAKCMLKEGIKTGQLTQEQVEALKGIIAKGSGKRPISAFDAANRAGMSYYYATVYKGMSLVGAHATAASTDAVFEENTEGFSPVFGPSDNNLEFCLGLIDKCLEEGAKYFDPILRPTN